MKVYLAGKVAKNDWRHKLVPNLRDASSEDASNETVSEWLPISFKLGRHTLQYTGPFFMSCDHGCAHGRSEHGNAVATNNVCGSEPWGDAPDAISAAKSAIFDRCSIGIRSCDLFFVWLDQRDAYGTLVEIGMAHMMAKQIWIASPGDFDIDDFWFAGRAAYIGQILQSTAPREGLLLALAEAARNTIRGVM